MSKDLIKRRVYKKFKIVKKYWEQKEIDWGVVTENEISKVKGQNLLFLYHDYFWAEQNNVSDHELSILTFNFKSILLKNKFDVYKTINEFDSVNGWNNGESLNFFKFLLIKKKINTDFNKRLNFETMKIWVT